MTSGAPDTLRTQSREAAKRVLVFGATGTIGIALTEELVARGHKVECVIRPRSKGAGLPAGFPQGAEVRYGAVTDKASLAREGFGGEPFDAVFSCMASRTGEPRDAWAIDHQAHLNVLSLAQAAGASHFVLLSALCVQKPKLAFQQAKLKFEEALIQSGITFSIVRPTAFFKSLSGQIDRVRQGKPFLLFGDGRLTACKPISDRDLANYLADCLDRPDRRNQVLPIGGPGPALTPLDQGELLFSMVGRAPTYTRVPVGLLDGIIAVLSGLGTVIPALRTKAELARIGRYYATESMLVLEPETGTYSAAATPQTGSDTLESYYRQLLEGEARLERGAHKVF
ncbi:MAG: NAD(P)H-binding protein [Pseudomonadota bacterium]